MATLDTTYKTHLSVNLNKIALLRNSRGNDYPCVLAFAKLAIASGAQGITVHPRPDQRHICVDDVHTLNDYIQGVNQSSDKKIEFNIEGNPFAEAFPATGKNTPYPGLLALIERTKPHQATLVPDSNDQLTSDHGFDLQRDGERLTPIIQQLHQRGVRCSLFMDPDKQQIQQAKAIGADRIELYTGSYAEAYQHSEAAAHAALARYREAAEYAHSIGLDVNAGHDLNLQNLPLFLTIATVAEVSIGHALTVDALLMGYEQAVQHYASICLGSVDTPLIP